MSILSVFVDLSWIKSLRNVDLNLQITIYDDELIYVILYVFKVFLFYLLLCMYRNHKVNKSAGQSSVLSPHHVSYTCLFYFGVNESNYTDSLFVWHRWPAIVLY